MLERRRPVAAESYRPAVLLILGMLFCIVCVACAAVISHVEPREERCILVAAR